MRRNKAARRRKLSQHPRSASHSARLFEVLRTSMRLGLISFGGPIAHLGYFRAEYVQKRKWLDDQAYADLVALCQFLPGPASSQVGIAIGMMRAGLWGGIASWIGFTLPSALALALFAIFLHGYDVTHAGWLHGLLIAAVVVVAHAVWGMARRITPDRARATLALLAAIVVLSFPTAYVQVVVIVGAGLVGRLFLKTKSQSTAVHAVHVPISRGAGIGAWVAFAGLLVILPMLAGLTSHRWLLLVDAFYRAGSWVFGGGHVVLPLLHAEIVTPGWVSDTTFLAGYGAAQAVPGPLFTFAAYLGAAMDGWRTAVVATVAIFLPSFLLVTGALPFWDVIRRHASFQAALNGVNAAVVGILLAALYDPIWTKAIVSPGDFSLGLAAFGLLMLWRVPAWAVVLFCAAGGALMSAF